MLCFSVYMLKQPDSKLQACYTVCDPRTSELTIERSYTKVDRSFIDYIAHKRR